MRMLLSPAFVATVLPLHSTAPVDDDAALPALGAAFLKRLSSPTRLSALSLKESLASAIQPSKVSSTASLSPAQLVSSFSTILLTALFLRLLGLNAQSSRIVRAAGRMSVQLSIMGIFLLTPLFAFASTSPLKIVGWITLVALLASKEAKSRSKYAYKGQMRDCFVAIFGGVGLTLAHLVTFVLHPPFSSSKMNISAQKIIPMAGMLFGNALSATTLGMSVLLSSFLESGREQVELRLSRGASVWEAALPAVREAVEAALMPTVNAMAATGLIFMPGMMTGQILGGQSPSAAAAYQIMIYIAIAASSCSTAMFLSGIVTARMFDLRHQALRPWRSIPGLREAEKPDADKERSVQPANSQSKIRFFSNGSSFEENSEPLLRVKQLTVESTNLDIPLLEVNAGDRIGISGRSGVGKTQLLRTLARLDPLSPNHKTIDTRNDVSLEGQSWNDISPSHWRSQVMWVSQDRPTLSGTPREFYKQILSYRTQHKQPHHENSKVPVQQLSSRPMEIARRWNLAEKTWDQPWNDISGGEAQRISLAIALALEPKVFLLDEPTSSCDAFTTAKIEQSFVNATVIMVSHSKEQLNRFCTNVIEISL